LAGYLIPLIQKTEITSLLNKYKTVAINTPLAIVKDAGLDAKNIDATFPDRSCVEVASLPLNAKVEIEVIASR
jgi:enamine deaminase RidA (YjgF/YER057c/UK114 family)